MSKRLIGKPIFLLSIFCLFLLLYGSSFVSNASENENRRVYDYASLLSVEELTQLEQTARELEEQFESEIYIITDKDSNGLSRKGYMENFADAKEVTNAVLLFINMEEDNRGYEVQGYGSAETYINDSRIERILDEMYSPLSKGDYYGACHTYLEEVAFYYGKDPSKDTIKKEPPSNYADTDKYLEKPQAQPKDRLLKSVIISFVISFFIALIVIICMLHNSKGKVTVNNYTYLDSGRSKITRQDDIYIRTTVTKQAKPKQTSSSSSSGSGTSSGGRSHSGGGRNF